MISVVIPTLNEVERLGALLADLGGAGDRAELIVVDGGSTDGTPMLAATGGATVIDAPPGRGGQLAAGAKAARGDVLLFLHADCRMPPGALTALGTILDETPEAVGGNFRLLFDGDEPFSRWLNGFYAKLRARGRYYGDSGIFVRRAAYRALGGIRPLALMEDYDLVRRMERFGPTVCVMDPPLVTASRRFAGRRPMGIIAGWIAIHTLYHLGMPTAWLARLYDSGRRRQRPAAYGS